MNRKSMGLLASLLMVVLLAGGIGDARQILIYEKKSTPFKSPFLKDYLNTYQGALLAISGEYQQAANFFSGNSVYNTVLLPFVASLNSTNFQATLKQLGSFEYKKGGDNVKKSLRSMIETLKQHLNIVNNTLTNLSGNIVDTLKDQEFVQAYNKLLRRKVYLSALTCSLYFEDYTQKIKLLLEVTKKDKDVLDKMIFNVGNFNTDNLLDQKCINDFKNYLIDTRESLFLLEQILDGFVSKIKKQTNLLFEDPLRCLDYQKSIETEIRNDLQDLATQILSLSKNILDSSKKLKQLLRMGKLNCKSLVNIQSGDQGRGKDLSEVLSKLNQILDQQPKEENGKDQQGEKNKRVDAQKIYEQIKSDEDLKRIEKESLEQIKETLKRKKHFPFYESVKNYFEEFYGKWWAEDKKTEGEILNEGW